MGINDLRTAIEGRVWVIENVLNRAKSMENIFALDDLYIHISSHKHLSKTSLLKKVKKGIRWTMWTSHCVGTSCCRHCRRTQYQDCNCFVTRTKAFSQ